MAKKTTKNVCVFCKALNRKPSVGQDVRSCWAISKFDKFDLARAFKVQTLESEDKAELDDFQCNNDVHLLISRGLYQYIHSRMRCIPSFYLFYRKTIL